MFSKMARKSKEISHEIKQLLVDLKREVQRICDIQRLLKISESTIRSIWKKFISTGNIENMPRSGRHRKMTKRAESRLLRLVRKTVSYHYGIKGGKYKIAIKLSREFYIKIRYNLDEQKMVVRGVNRKKRLSWCLARRKRLEASHI